MLVTDAAPPGLRPRPCCYTTCSGARGKVSWGRAEGNTVMGQSVRRAATHAHTHPDGYQDTGHLERRGPFVLQDVEAECPICVDCRVAYSGTQQG